MNGTPRWTLLALALGSGGCFASAGPRPPQPDAASPRWRSLTGCYQMADGQFVLDSVPDVKLNADRPGVRRALFAPTPPIVGGYWFVSDRGSVLVTRHDGLWGRTYELTQRGDTLAGREFVRTDAHGDPSPPTPAVAVRTASCRVEAPLENWGPTP